MGEYSIFMQYDAEDKIFVASVPELPGCMAHGKTREQALKELDIAKSLWIETAEAIGKAIPQPSLYSVPV